MVRLCLILVHGSQLHGWSTISKAFKHMIVYRQDSAIEPTSLCTEQLLGTALCYVYSAAVPWSLPNSEHTARPIHNVNTNSTTVKVNRIGGITLRLVLTFLKMETSTTGNCTSSDVYWPAILLPGTQCDTSDLQFIVIDLTNQTIPFKQTLQAGSIEDT